MPRHPSYRKKTYKKVPRAIKQYVAKKLDNAIEDKHKFLSAPTELGSVSTNWVYSNCCNITQGATEEQRIGRKIRIKSVVLDGWLTGGDNTNLFRLVLLLADASSPLASCTLNTDIRPEMNYTGGVSKKYYDRVHYLSYMPVDGSTATTIARGKHVHFFKRFKRPILITYGDDSATYWDKMLMWCALSDSAAPSNPGFLQGHMTCTFEDA